MLIGDEVRETTILSIKSVNEQLGALESQP